VVVINLLMLAVSFSLASLVEEKMIFKCTDDSQVWGNFYGVSHLSYRIRSPSRPP
jgi:hypothetical protein